MRRLPRRILDPRLGWALSLSCTCSYAALSPAPVDLQSLVSTEAKIRVRLEEAAAKAQVRGFDLRIYEGQAKSIRKAAFAPDRQSEWEFTCQDGRIRAISVTPGQPRKTRDLQEPVIVNSLSGFMNLDGRPYRNELHIYSIGSLCEVVNHVDLEKYLHGLVNSEFSTRWNEQSIAAQVIAARTYAYHQIREVRATRPESHFDVDATDRDQVYDGSLKEDFKASRSVEQTRGWILTVGDKKVAPIKAFYHSTCGGATELPEHVWKRKMPGFKRVVYCPFCVQSPRYRWDTEFTTEEIAKGIIRGARSAGAPGDWPKDWDAILSRGRLLELDVEKKDPEGRVSHVSTLWKIGQKMVRLTLPGSRFREWVSSSKLKSVAFDIVLSAQDIALGRWRFVGKGFGHGVGMCQWGAKVMGDKGYTAASILKHYYPDANLRKVW